MSATPARSLVRLHLYGILRAASATAGLLADLKQTDGQLNLGITKLHAACVTDYDDEWDVWTSALALAPSHSHLHALRVRYHGVARAGNELPWFEMQQETRHRNVKNSQTATVDVTFPPKLSLSFNHKVSHDNIGAETIHRRSSHKGRCEAVIVVPLSKHHRHEVLAKNMLSQVALGRERAIMREPAIMLSKMVLAIHIIFNAEDQFHELQAMVQQTLIMMVHGECFMRARRLAIWTSKKITWTRFPT
ncbi:hypothetical protein BCR37DRAFT_405527 [Protomyces lactucae-debilis]|uniref:Uncharacterized protein n=1 Tax=Protomyces lactucae-debilis TaxID=2754530 RepID=A0A1Y2F315_PROLT|nr:uncharacterized protein BCR37DRAFT_405527 [Protomyces lactucae-debilis]ORY78259.1 hypothetical protein BCR37DRAFT_405527 [Protomyces lactucae-debilis]